MGDNVITDTSPEAFLYFDHDHPEGDLPSITEIILPFGGLVCFVVLQRLLSHE